MKLIHASLLTGIVFFLVTCEEKVTPDPDPVQIEFIECLEETGSATFDIVTWNLEEFPKRGFHTAENVTAIFSELEADLIAIQEIEDLNEFNSLVTSLEGWNGYVHQSNGLNLAFMYKEKEVALTGDPQPLFKDETYLFPRPPLFVSATHTNGLSLFLINIHLKCCDGEENEHRRREAGRLLKNYIDQRLSGEPVIVLGDFNDEISINSSEENIFYSFVADSLNYRFTDMDIAMGAPENWSYPGWPSHIDHVLITNELFSRSLSTSVMSFDNCDPEYVSNISDHRPLMIRLEP